MVINHLWADTKLTCEEFDKLKRNMAIEAELLITSRIEIQLVTKINPITKGN